MFFFVVTTSNSKMAEAAIHRDSHRNHPEVEDMVIGINENKTPESEQHQDEPRQLQPIRDPDSETEGEPETSKPSRASTDRSQWRVYTPECPSPVRHPRRRADSWHNYLGRHCIIFPKVSCHIFSMHMLVVLDEISVLPKFR